MGGSGKYNDLENTDMYLRVKNRKVTNKKEKKNHSLVKGGHKRLF